MFLFIYILLFSFIIALIFLAIIKCLKIDIDIKEYCDDQHDVFYYINEN